MTKTMLERSKLDPLLIKKRVERIELSTKAWEAFVLPLNYTRVTAF